MDMDQKRFENGLESLTRAYGIDPKPKSKNPYRIILKHSLKNIVRDGSKSKTLGFIEFGLFLTTLPGSIFYTQNRSEESLCKQK